MTKAEMMLNKGTILERFSPEFIEKIKYNSSARAIFETLSREDNPYAIIEMLVSKQEELGKEIERLIISNPPRYVVVPNNYYL
jgi:hypothetical protein